MKISELTPLSSLQTAAQIPIAIEGENRSLTLGQIIDALASSVVPFARINSAAYDVESTGMGQTVEALPIVFDSRATHKNFYALKVTTSIVAGVIRRSAIFYTNFPNREKFYDDNGIRTDCLFIATDGRLYRYNGTDLISAGITDEQAELLQKLTPKELASEAELEALKAAGEIVPGQLYYIAETE